MGGGGMERMSLLITHLWLLGSSYFNFSQPVVSTSGKEDWNMGLLDFHHILLYSS